MVSLESHSQCEEANLSCYLADISNIAISLSIRYEVYPIIILLLQLELKDQTWCITHFTS